MAKDKISTQDILKILALTGLVVASGVIPTLPLAAHGVVKVWKNITREDFGRIIKRLEKQEMISIKEQRDQVAIEITDKGRRRLLEYDFENIELKNKRRDGKWRLIIFDIPEELKNARDVFRRKLVELGFIRLQDSVWVSAFPCKNEIDFLSNFLGISDFVTLVSLDKIERGENLVFEQYYISDN